MQYFSIVSIIAFFLLIFLRTFKTARMPIHLRWELFPIPKNKILYMVKEIFLMGSIYKRKRRVWFFSLLLHLGIYLSLLFLLFLILRQIFSIWSLEKIDLSMIFFAYLFGTVGSFGLFILRLFDPDLKGKSVNSRYFNLFFLFSIFGSGLYSVFSTDFFEVCKNYMHSLIFLEVTSLPKPAFFHFFTVSLFLLYLPFTDMSHFIMKYFTYHRLRWDEETVDRKMEERLLSLYSQPLSWSADHISGRRSWVDIKIKLKDNV